MNHKTSIREIVLKFNRGETLSPEEDAELEAWRERVLLDEKELDLFPEAEWPEEKKVELPGMPEAVWDDIGGRIKEQEKRTSRPRDVARVIRVAGTVAAVLIIIIAAGRYGYRYQHSLRTPGVSAAISWETIDPGHYHGQRSEIGGTQIIDSSIIGQPEPFRRQLPDGSIATLSYGSSLTYGANFSDSAREVWLEGQASFDIVKDSRRPFFVHSGSATVQVLGTRFNWMHYPGVASEITLLNGRVRLECGLINQELAPAEQAVLREEQGQEGPTTKISVQKLEDPKKSIAWMNANPTIEFTNVDLYTVVQRLAHYYKVGVKWSPAVRGDLVIASLSLRNSLSQNIEVIAYAVKGFARVEAKDGLIQVTI